ncbi:MAG TPA: aminoglycoside phosphotransferase family protein [Streptosporangiaceae bacterium]|nr:aminoglycoside phosphotransferase family protein [Streptosporangiaceae bacterium]
MPGDLIGDPLWAVLIPPRLERFRSLAGLGEADLAVDLTGWNKYVLLAGERVFLFPREAENVAWFDHEAAVYQALAAGGFALAPQVRGRWRDDSVYPFPFAEVTRLHGTPLFRTQPGATAALFGPFGAVVARIHQVPPLDLPQPPLIERHHRPAWRWLHRALSPDTFAEAAAEAAERLDRPSAEARWRARLGAAASLRPVLVHGDLHEDQLLAEGGRITGILDWETARVDHPFWDFDLGEWGTGLWRRHRGEFSALWAMAWREYAAVRGLDPDPAPLETAFRLRQALALLDQPGDPAVTGTVAEHLAAIS